MLRLCPCGAEQNKTETKSLALAVVTVDVTDGIYMVFIIESIYFFPASRRCIVYTCCICFVARNTSTTDRQTCGKIVGKAFRCGASVHVVLMSFRFSINSRRTLYLGEKARKRYTASLPRHKAVHKSTPWLLPTILHAD